MLTRIDCEREGAMASEVLAWKMLEGLERAEWLDVDCLGIRLGNTWPEVLEDRCRVWLWKR